MRIAIVQASGLPQLDVSIAAKTIDTGETLVARGLLDSGCSRTSIDAGFVKKHRLTTAAAEIATPVYNADRTLNGYLWEYVELLVTIRDSVGRVHREKCDFAVANLSGNTISSSDTTGS